jgi:hypothetical protein
MLARPEQDAPAARDRRARQHGQALLQALARLQAALIGGGDEVACLHHLTAVTKGYAAAADPGLAAIIQALSLRAQVELARRSL